MKKWHIREFSKLTGVSVRTLHHYDRLGPLKASERQLNGFRLYDKKNLHVLLQILSLKFLRFDLTTIKGFLDGRIPVQEKFLTQAKLLGKEMDKLDKAKKILEDVGKLTSLAPRELVWKIIELYRIPHQLKKLRVRKLLPQIFLEKSKEYKGRMYDIHQQVGVISNDDLLRLCIKFLEEVYLLAPDLMLHQKDVFKEVVKDVVKDAAFKN